MQVNADLHIHSRYSGATSKKMELPTIARQASLKGLDLVGTGDALQGRWLKEIKKLESCGEGVYCHGKTRFIVTFEVEDPAKVHHFAILPGISSAQSLREEFSKHSYSLRDGRPKLSLSGEEIADIVSSAGGLVGPSHAFVPWTSVYKEYDSLKECYRSSLGKIKFLELGLSADSYMADRVKELQNLSFLSNSDAHSPWPNKLGREFNRIELKELSFKSIAMAMERRGGNRVVLNIGFDPRLGKYHRSACIKCYSHYNIGEARRLRWRCSECRGRIKKGVLDRIREIASWEEPRHPEHRPRYMRIAPLSEIIATSLGTNNYSKKVQELWHRLVGNFGSEISVLIDAGAGDIAEVAGELIAERISSFRRGEFSIREGGGGRYGKIYFGETMKKTQETKAQRSLDSF